MACAHENWLPLTPQDWGGDCDPRIRGWQCTYCQQQILLAKLWAGLTPPTDFNVEIRARDTSTAPRSVFAQSHGDVVSATKLAEIEERLGKLELLYRELRHIVSSLEVHALAQEVRQAAEKQEKTADSPKSWPSFRPPDGSTLQEALEWLQKMARQAAENKE